LRRPASPDTYDEPDEAMKAKPVPANQSPDAPSDLGPRLRAIRISRGLGLRELARRLDLSPSSISQIETGKIGPSVRTLYALASEFGVTVDEVLFDKPPVPGTQDQSPPTVEPGLAVQRAADRPAIQLNSGVRWERLMFWGDEDVEFLEAVYEPGGAPSPDDALVRHNGHEFGHVLSGTLRVIVGFDEYVLVPGDSITFPSSTPHRLVNDGPETVRAIWVVRGRRGSDIAHESTEVALSEWRLQRIDETAAQTVQKRRA
jgi:transcriptional regulator with XRE-family HTH domain